MTSLRVKSQDYTSCPSAPSRFPDIRQQWGPPPPSIRDVGWRGQLPAPGTCQISDVPVLLAAAPMLLHLPGSQFFILPSGTALCLVAYRVVACPSAWTGQPQS